MCKSLNLIYRNQKGEKIIEKAVSGIMLLMLLMALLSSIFDIKPTHAQESSFNGYTLFPPMASDTTYLINNSGEVVQAWASDFRPRHSAYLLEDGNLLRSGEGGHIQLIKWNGTVVWDYETLSNDHRLHHDIEGLPNGNVLMIAQETKTSAEAIAAGRNPDQLPIGGELWPDHIIEVEPTGTTEGNIVWEWHIWDHLVQDYDPIKENYGVVADHPELVDINFGTAAADWNHMNSIAYNEEFDQILVSVNAFQELWVIDHSTTTEEAAGHAGGTSGRGGDLLYRWGNPQTYRAGDEGDKKLFRQHDAQWIEPGCPGEGNILVFNNGQNRPDGSYSSVDEIVPPVDENGNYSLTLGSAYGPEEPTWIYTAAFPPDFYSPNLSGAQRLPNGNTLICTGSNGHFFEVTPQKEIVWEYTNPFPEGGGPYRVFKVRRYAPDYPGLAVWRADVNGDGIVDPSDIILVAEAFGSSPGDSSWNLAADLVEDELIDISDLDFVAKNFGKTV